MIRIIFVLIIGIHSLIHVMGFMKAFGLAEIKELTLPISKPTGIIWLFTFLLFTASLIQYLIKNEFWWLTALSGVLISQVLVISFWQEAKFGTIANVIILAVAVVALGGFQFDRKVSHEINQMFSKAKVKEASVIRTEDIAQLPKSVQKWLTNSGIIGKTEIQAVRLKQNALIKMKPKQEKWNHAYAEQYFTTDKPAFIWKVDMKMMPLIKVKGRDKFSEGKGEMLMKILGLFPVVNQSNNRKINSGALQRYLAEIVWFPSAALSPYITWKKVDDHSAKAVMNYKGTTGSGTFTFDEKGDFLKFHALRYMGGKEDAEHKEWIITVQETQTHSGIRVPVKLEVTWKLDTGDWTWLKIEITDIEYHKPMEYD